MSKLLADNVWFKIEDGYQKLSDQLAQFVGFGTAAGKYLYTTDVKTWAEGDITAAGRALLDDADASAQRTTLGLGSSATVDTGTSGAKLPKLNAANTWSAAQSFDAVTLTDQASITWDWSLGPVANVTLGGARALAAPTNIPTGKTGTWSLTVIQDGTGSRTLSFDSSYLFPGGNDPVLSTTAGAVDLITFLYDGSRIMGAISKAYA
jgi:hypothetical protein